MGTYENMPVQGTEERGKQVSGVQIKFWQTRGY